MESSSEVNELLKELKDALAARGATTTYALGRAFRNLDSFDGNKRVDKNEFLTGLKEYGLNITSAQAGVLLKWLDKDGDGFINFDEFITGLRGSLNPTRQDVVDQAFKKLDKDGSGTITTADLKGVYSAKNHPKVKSGELTEEDVFKQFLQSFGDKNHDSTVTKEEWNEYYGALSSSVDNDEEFVEIIKHAWKL